ATPLGPGSTAQSCDQVVEARSRDRQDLREVLAIGRGDASVAVLADGPCELRQGFVQLARRCDERVIAERRDLWRDPVGLLARVKDPFDLIVQSEERELAGDDLPRKGLPATLVLELHDLVRGGEGVVPAREHVTNVDT